MRSPRPLPSDAIIDVQSQFEFWYPIQIHQFFMPKNKSRQRSTKRGPKLTDLPIAVKHTYDTMSCRMPNITQTCTLRVMQSSSLMASGSAAVSQGYIFSLSGSGTGSAFFDRYKIEAIRFTMVPQNNAVQLLTSTSASLTDAYVVVDYDDATALSSSAAAQTYATCVKLSPGQSCSRLFAPRLAVAAYTGSFTGFLNQGPQWIDSASATVQHYGIKVFIPPTGVVGQTALQTWDIGIEYYLAFKNTI